MEIESKKNELSSPDYLAGLTIEVSDMMEHIQKMVVCTSNIKAVSDYRTANNKFIKSVEAKVEEIKSEVIRQTVGEDIDRVLAIIAPLKEANKKFSADILEADKQRYKDKAQETFGILNDGGQSGEIYDWESFYEDKWYKLTQIQLIEAIQKKLKRVRMREDAVDKTYFITATPEQYEGLDRYLESNGIAYERTE